MPKSKVDCHIDLKENIWEKYNQEPSFGSKRIVASLHRDGVMIKRSLVRKLMREMNIKGLTPKRNLSIPKPGAQKFPYLLKEVQVQRPNQVWSTDITYIKTPGGFMYLTSIIDVYSRKILSWELSNTMSKDFCISCFKKAVKAFGAPEIINTDQGSQYTIKEFVQEILSSGALLSMDGKDRCLDNVWVERFWRTIKHEYLYLYEHKTTLELYSGIKSYINYYNSARVHSSLGYLTLNEACLAPCFVFKKISLEIEGAV